MVDHNSSENRPAGPVQPGQETGTNELLLELERLTGRVDSLRQALLTCLDLANGLVAFELELAGILGLDSGESERLLRARILARVALLAGNCREEAAPGRKAPQAG